MDKPISCRKGDLVEVIFLDHVENGEKPIKFCVYGRVAHQDKASISVDCWGYLDEKEKYDPRNVQRYTLVRSCIIKINKLERS